MKKKRSCLSKSDLVKAIILQSIIFKTVYLGNASNHLFQFVVGLDETLKPQYIHNKFNIIFDKHKLLFLQPLVMFLSLT